MFWDKEWILGLLFKKKICPDLLRSWYLFELLHSSPIIKTSKNIIKRKLEVDGFGHLSFGGIFENPTRKPVEYSLQSCWWQKHKHGTGVK